MVIGGTVVTTVGLVLLYQDQTGRWESWAYAWALVGPAASGLGLLLWGMRSGDARRVRNGTWALLGGLGLFVVGFLFFEGVIGIGGEPSAPGVGPAGRRHRDRRRDPRRAGSSSGGATESSLTGARLAEAHAGAVSLRRDARDRSAAVRHRPAR